MLRIILMIVLVAAALLQGCAAEPNKRLKIGPYTTRAEVEELLGEPVEVEETDEGRVYTYSYAIEDNISERWFANCSYVCFLVLATLPVTAIVDASGVRDETQTLFIAYGPDNRVASAETGEQRDQRLATEREKREIEKLALSGDAEAQYQMGVRYQSEKTERRKWLLLAAEQGHAEAMFALGNYSDAGSEEQWRWYCHAAMQGFPKAQFKLGEYYHSGDAPGGADLSKALFWYTLSGAGGYSEGQSRHCYYDANVGYTCTNVIREIRSDLSDEAISDVEQALAEWQPNPAACYESDEAQATN